MKKRKTTLFLLIVTLLFVTTIFTPVTAQAESLKLNHASMTMKVNESKTLKLLTDTKGKVTWKSSDTKVATVSAKGKVKAKKAGTVVITAKIKAKKASCKITVKKSSGTKAAAKKNAKAYQKQIADIVKYTNQYRLAEGLPELKLDDTLTLAACHRSTEMAKAKVLSHQRPDGSTPWDLMKHYGITYSSAGENIAYTGGYGIAAQKVTQMWYDSSGHRANILRSSFGKIGVGIAVADNGVVYYTQLFTN